MFDCNESAVFLPSSECGDCSQFTDAINALRTTVAELQSALTKLQSAVTTQGSSISSLQTTVTSQGNSISTINTTLSNKQDKLVSGDGIKIANNTISVSDEVVYWEDTELATIAITDEDGTVVQSNVLTKP